MRSRDYQNKSFKNPLFSKTSRGRSTHRWRFKFIILFGTIISGLILLSQKPFFEIKEVSINGSKTVSAKEISQVINEQLTKKRFWFFSQKSLLFFDAGELEKHLTQNYIFSGLEIKKQPLHKLTIDVQEEIAPFFWFGGGKKYYLNPAGLAIKEVSNQDLLVQDGGEGTAIIRFSPSETNYPVVFDQSNSEVRLGQSTIDPAEVNFITELTNAVANSADFEIARYMIASPGPLDLILVTTEGWQVYFRLTEPLDQQFNKLLMLLQQRLGNRANLEYIDLRFAEKVFYK